jgi:hypothetical protein
VVVSFTIAAKFRTPDMALCRTYASTQFQFQIVEIKLVSMIAMVVSGLRIPMVANPLCNIDAR